MSSFNDIKGMGENIKQVVFDSYKKGKLKISTLNGEETIIDIKYLEKIKKIPQIAPFFDMIE